MNREKNFAEIYWKRVFNNENQEKTEVVVRSRHRKYYLNDTSKLNQILIILPLQVS